MLLVAAARHVIREDPASHRGEVEASEHGDHSQALHRHREVRADHGREPVRLALEREECALDLLVVLKLDLEQLDDLDGKTGGTGNPDRRVLIGAEHLVHVTVGYQVAHGCSTVPAMTTPPS